MAMTLSGSGTITGLVAGGLPDATVTTTEILDANVTPAKLSTGAPTWNTSGNLGLGVTPSAWDTTLKSVLQTGSAGAFLTGQGSSEGVYLGSNAYYNGGWKYVVNGYATHVRQQSGVFAWYNAPSGTAGNAISFTQAMTLDASGNLLVGTTTPFPGHAGLGGNINDFMTESTGSIFASRNDSNPAAQFNRGGTDGEVVILRKGSNSVGSISVTSTATSYNTSSDYRLKNITGPVTTSGAYIDSLNPVEGTWKADGSTFVGLIAHEVQEVSRTNVATGEKDGEQMQAMDYSNSELIANLIAEVKSLRQRIAALETK